MLNFLGNETSVHTAVWKPEPDYRGTWGILSTCLITLSLCLWKAVHLNVPAHGETWQQMARKVGWLALGLLAPEMVAFTAFTQYKDARSFTREIRNLAQVSDSRKEKLDDLERPASELERLAKSWNIVNSYLAVMGGFAIESRSTDHEKGRFFPQGREKMAITPKGMLWLLEKNPSTFPDVTSSEIKDRSKADSITKTLIVIQALWFCTQCITRLAQGLSISLLELNTLGHSICAFLVYVLWWHKPQDIWEPVLLPGHDLHLFAAFLSLHGIPSSGSRRIHDYPLGSGPYFDSEGYWKYANLSYAPSSQSRVLGTNRITRASSEAQGMAQLQALQGQRGISLPRLLMGQNLYSHSFRERPIRGEDVARTGVLGLRRPYVELDEFDMQRMKLAATAISKYQLDHKDIGSFSEARGLARRVRNWPHFRLSSPDWSIYIAFSLAGAAYGGLHLLAWNGPFSSAAVTTLWRVSGIIVASSGLSLPVLYIYHRNPRMSRTDTFVRRFVDRILRITESLSEWLMLLGPIPYIFARMFLVVECFLQLAHLPDSVYQETSWSGYFPHIS